MFFKLTAATLALACTSLAEDIVRFTNGDIMSGSIIDITDNGAIRFAYPDAADTLEISADGLTSLTFDQPNDSLKSHGERLYLTNGDELPCDIKSMDDKSIQFSTWYAGDFVVPRSEVSKIRFDNKLESTIFSGPNNLEEWDDAENWTVDQQTLMVNGQGVISKAFDLTNNFIIRFNLEWEGSSPRFRLHMCGRENTTTNRIDRYYLDFNSAGFQFTRVTPRNFQKLGKADLLPRELKQPRITIELKVDRQNQQIVLYVNGQELGSFDDTSSSSPIGTFVVFESNQRDGDILRIKNLQILEWGGNALTRQKNEEIANKDADTLFDSEGLRFSGAATKIAKTNDKLTIFFDSKFSKDTLKVPSSRAAMLYLREQETDVEEKKSAYTASLIGGGKISLGQTSLNQEEAVTKHPILGECHIKRSAFRTLNATTAKTNTP